MSPRPHPEAELAARASYGRLLASLTRRTRDLALAEDVLGEAFAEALARWPIAGVPESPEGWLLTVARRKWQDALRHEKVHNRPEILAALRAEEEVRVEAFTDDRIRLMLVCAHAAIDAATRPALILQVVLGIDAKTMASAFLLSEDAMTKRLVRAKQRIRALGLKFEEPEPEDLEPRLQALLEAIYAAYFLGRDSGDPSGLLDREAVYLAGVVSESLPRQAEALGLFALLTLAEARRPAQWDVDGRFVPLLEQDPARWDREKLRGGLWVLERAAALGVPGPFQIEAAISAAHCHRARTGVVPWPEIASLYRRLVSDYPTVGSAVSMAVALAHAEGPQSGQRALSSLDEARVAGYQPYWVARAHVAELAGDGDRAREALTRAIGLTVHPPVADFLRTWRARLEGAERLPESNPRQYLGIA